MLIVVGIRLGVGHTILGVGLIVVFYGTAAEFPVLKHIAEYL